MKILSIESPQRLKDRTVKASFTVADEDFIPLIMLADRAYKGDEIRIDDSKEKETTPAYEVLINIQTMLKSVAQEIAKLANKEGVLVVPEEINKEDV